MNRVVHFEVHAKDLDRAEKFYSDIFGWKITDMGPQMGNYRMAITEGDQATVTGPGINGGITPRQGEAPNGSEPVNAFVCTLTVDNVDSYIEKVKSSGGSMATDKMNVPGVGMLVYVKDPEGNIFGMLQPEVAAS